MRLPIGKINPQILERIIFSYLGAKHDEVILGPSIGEDGALLKIGNKIVATSMDPITGALDRIGWLAVHVNANDIATFGIRPLFFSSCILLPNNAGEAIIETICSQIDAASKSLGIEVIGGHSEITRTLKQPMIVGSCIGISEDECYVTSHGSENGNLLILTKGAGIEGTAILASEKHDDLKDNVGEDVLASAQRFYDKVSIVKEALLAFSLGGVRAMHDPTEGGILGGIHELCDAASLGIRIYKKQITLAKETRVICEFFGIDPLQLISSGALLISVERESAENILKNIRFHGIDASIIGEFIDETEKRVLIEENGSSRELERPLSDQLWVVIEK